MKHPAYHLHPNKAADRFAFIDAIMRLERFGEGGLEDYTYHGLGGPYLEDFRLLYEFCPDIGMVSIESNGETYKRQHFHLPSSRVKLVRSDVTSFIAQYDPENVKSVFWLDFSKLRYEYFENFTALLGLVEEMSMIKVTLRCEPRSYGPYEDENLRKRETEKFCSEFEKVMPEFPTVLPGNLEEFAGLLQNMLRIAVGQILPSSATTLTFLPVSSFCYQDTETGMFTLTGVVCDNSRRDEVERVYGGWAFANLSWSLPVLIDVPILSTKERLHLQHLLPSNSTPGSTLQQALGYRIDSSERRTEAAMERYAAFHRYSPYVLRGVP